MGSIERPLLAESAESYSDFTPIQSFDSKINSIADEFLERASTFINNQHIEGGRRLGSPQVKSYTSNQIQYLIAYFVMTFAKMGYQLCYSLMTVGGSIQNPMLILFNALSPELYNNFKLTSTITLILYGATGTVLAGLIGKTFLGMVIIVVSSQSVLNTDFVGLYLFQYLAGNTIPEFLTYAAPMLGTASYFMTL